MRKLLGVLLLCALASCKNTTVDLNSLTLVPTTAPMIQSAGSSSFSATIGVQTLPFSFVNSGGTISDCVISPPLPLGLSFNKSTCEITGIPSTPQSDSSYTIRASNVVGISSPVNFTIVILATPEASISFGSPGASVSSGTAAGPGNNLGGNPNLTFVDATVSGNSIVAYKYKFISSSVKCSDALPSYSNEISTSIQIMEDLSKTSFSFLDFRPSNVVTVCVIGKNIANTWQADTSATSVSWTKDVDIQDLMSLGPASTSKEILMRDQPLGPSSTVDTRYFSIANPNNNLTVSCTNCLFSTDGGLSFNSAQTILTLQQVKIKFRVTPSSSPDSFITQTPIFTLTGSSSATISLYVRTINSPATAINPFKKIFLSKSTHNGDFSSLGTAIASGVDNFCQAEAEANKNLFLPKPVPSFKAMLTSRSSAGVTTNGMSLLFSTMDYHDVIRNNVIISNQMFVNSFSKFIDGSLTNGFSFSSSDWKYAVNAPRYLSGTQFWFGSDSSTCSNWSSTATVSATTESGGVLSHDSAGSNISVTANLPTHSTYGTTLYGSCADQNHVVCYEP